MAGLYLHIPFCRKACTYCDFHFSTSMGMRERVLHAMHAELDSRAGGPGTSPLGSVYFGGGTPSLLTPDELGAFLAQARMRAGIAPDAEITIEANPDDIHPAALAAWKEMGITRVSLGTQSFRDERLRWMGRAHDSRQALASIASIAQAGFTSWTIDLIYGLPGMTLTEWDEQMSIALDHAPPHLSAYCLTIEERTALGHQLRKGALRVPDDGDQAEQFDRLIDRMATAGLQQYEISNFARPGHLAVHNANYWKGIPYIGIGPSAHSFDGKVRRWNIANNARYTEALAKGGTYWEEEHLTRAQQVNERIMTGLRTSWGVDLGALGMDLLALEAGTIARYVEQGDIRVHDGRLLLTRQGRRIADRIASDLFQAT